MTIYDKVTDPEFRIEYFGDGTRAYSRESQQLLMSIYQYDTDIKDFLKSVHDITVDGLNMHSLNVAVYYTEGKSKECLHLGDFVRKYFTKKLCRIYTINTIINGQE